MSDYNGPSQHVRVRIRDTGGWKEYAGQECDAILYREDMNAHINTEQLKPPLPKWQQAKRSDIEVLT